MRHEGEDGMAHEDIIRILLVDDVELVRHALRTILSAYPRFAIVGEACDGEEAPTMRSLGSGDGYSDAAPQRHPGDGAHKTVFPPRDRSETVRPRHGGPAPRDDYSRRDAYSLKTMPAHGSIKKSRKPWITGPRCYRNGIPTSGR